MAQSVFKAEIIEDAGVADVITVRAGTAISGGMMVVLASGAWAAYPVASGTVAAFTSACLTSTSVTPSGTSIPCGVALNDVASGTNSYVGVLRKGTVIMPSNDSIVIANHVASAAAAASSSAAIGVPAATDGSDVIGHSYSPAASGGYAIVRLDL